MECALCVCSGFDVQFYGVFFFSFAGFFGQVTSAGDGEVQT